MMEGPVQENCLALHYQGRNMTQGLASSQCVTVSIALFAHSSLS